MYIRRSIFHEANPVSGDWIVKGQIAIDGEFTRDEWEQIKTNFIAMGLLQVSKGQKPLSKRVPSRNEVMAAIQDIASGRDPEAWNKLVEKYQLPNGSRFNASTGQFIIPPET